MSFKERVAKLLNPLLDQHSYFSVEYLNDSFRLVMENRNPNLLGNFAGGDMAYIANASAGLQCVAGGPIAQTASINIECIARGDGEYLVADSKIVHSGSKFIRVRTDVYVRQGEAENLVAIAQINLSSISNQKQINDLLKAATD